MMIWVVAIALLLVAAAVPYGPWIALGLLAGGFAGQTDAVTPKGHIAVN
jgi:hypothetical protein